jgi:hypothetical protein
MAGPIAAAVAGSLATGLFNQRSANKQMRFQDQQSRTQYQRAVADMKAAGINPMLSAKVGPNAAMSGAMATMPDLGATMNSAQSIANQRPVQQAQTRKLLQEAYQLIPQQVRESIQRIAESASRVQVNNAQKQQIFRQIDKIGSEIESMASTRSLQAIQERLAISQEQINGIIYGLKKAELPAAWAAETFWQFLDEQGLTTEAKAAQFLTGLMPLLDLIPNFGLQKYLQEKLTSGIPQRAVRIQR